MGDCDAVLIGYNKKSRTYTAMYYLERDWTDSVWGNPKNGYGTSKIVGLLNSLPSGIPAIFQDGVFDEIRKGLDFINPNKAYVFRKRNSQRLDDSWWKIKENL